MSELLQTHYRSISEKSDLQQRVSLKKKTEKQGKKTIP